MSAEKKGARTWEGLFLFLGCTCGTPKFLGSGEKPHHGGDNARSSTHCTTKELTKAEVLISVYWITFSIICVSETETYLFAILNLVPV